MKPTQLDIYRTAIPMRSFSHAAAERDLAEAVVVRLQFSDGLVGWGETLPRDYVTGETYESAVNDIAEHIWPRCLDDGLLEPSEHPKDIPATGGGRRFNAAAAAVDIASLRRVFHKLHEVSPTVLQNLAGRPRLRGVIDATVSGVLGYSDPGKTACRLRLMKLGEMRDYKLKLGLGEDVDRENLRIIRRKLGRLIRKGVVSLRVDINGGWEDEDTIPQRVAELKAFGVCCVEQPMYCSAGQLLDLSRRCELPLMADESLLTERHAEKLLAEPEKIWWNLRISKNGGLLPTLRLMQLAHKHNVTFGLGCMVGESSILSAAQRRLLQMAPPPRFVEGNYGRWLLTDDLLPGRKSLRPSFGGTLRVLNGDGLGIEVSQAKVEEYGELVRTLKA